MRRRIEGSDRVLVGIFVLHLVAAMVFGAMFLQGLDEDRQVIVEGVASGGTVVDGAASGPSPSATPSTGGSGPGASDADDGATTAATPQDDRSAPPGPRDEATGGGVTATDEPEAGDADGDRAVPEQAPTGPIRIGTLVTQTGAINFRAAAQATKAYIDMVNEQGGVHGRPIELVLRDDGLDPARGRRAVEEMLNQDVFALVGFVAPLTEQSINPTLEQNQIPLVGAFGITASDWGYMFNGFFESFGWVSGRFLADEGATTPGIIYISRQDDVVDRRVAASWRQGFASRGLELRDENIFAVDVTKSSYDDVVTQLRLNGVDGIATSIDQTAIIRLQQSMDRARYRPLHAASQLADDPTVLGDPDVGASLEGSFVYSEFHFLGEQAGDMPTYEDEVRRRFGDDAELNWAGKNNWMSTRLFVEALEAAGPGASRADLMAALNGFTDHPTGMSMPLTIGPDPVSHIRNNRCVKMGRIVQGEVEPLGDFECYDGALL